MLAGILARTQFGLAQARTSQSSNQLEQQRESRRRLLNDALIFLCAQASRALYWSAAMSPIWISCCASVPTFGCCSIGFDREVVPTRLPPKTTAARHASNGQSHERRTGQAPP